MLNFKEYPDYIETELTGKHLMTVAQLNKGTAFSLEERQQFGLLGKLPSRIETLEEQTKRAYVQYQAYQSDLQKHIYLNNLHDKNQVLFYTLINDHLTEMIPYIYTPIIATAVQQFSREFRQSRGLYINYEDKDNIDKIFDNRSNPEIELIVVTDGEGVLGIGDQGIGSINIPIAKLMVYTLCAGINPLRTLPIYLDVGTSNPTHLNDPFYLGQRHPRIRGQEYDDFIARFVETIQRKFPKVFLHWEDFGRNNARRILDSYQHEICTFNDDIQGTGVVTLAAILAGVKQAGGNFNQQRIIIFGAGTAGTGIADQIYAALRRNGLNEKEARECFWLVDRPGLLTTNCEELTISQKPYARTANEVKHWQRTSDGRIDLAEVVKNIHPTILIGSSAQRGSFTKEIIQSMAQFVEQPIILPLSNPTEYAEAVPPDLLEWTNGKALIATGSPFPAVNYRGKEYRISQCNNAFAFPGIGLGVIATQARLLSDDMIWAACHALSDTKTDGILPSFNQAQETALNIAVAVAKQAIEEKLHRIEIKEDIVAHIKSMMWTAKYLPLRLKSHS